MRFFLFLWINLFFLHGYSSKYRQERAKITYFNPEYISKATTFTSRSKRGEHYRTNVTVALTTAWNNNVTMRLVYKAKESKLDFTFAAKICDLFTHEWLQKFMKKFSKMSWICPVKPEEYAFINIDLDGNVLPIPMPKGRNTLYLLFYTTRAETRLLEAEVSIFVD